MMSNKDKSGGGIILTPDDPIHGLLTQVGQVSDQLKVFNGKDKDVVGFDGTQSKNPNMKLHIPTETYVNYSDCSEEREIINLLIIAIILLIIFIVVNNRR